MLHIPLLRAGRPYRSLQVATVTDVRDGSPVAEVSQAIAGLIARDLGRAAEHQAALQRVPVAELVEICHRAAKLFAEAELPLGEGTQTP